MPIWQESTSHISKESSLLD